MGAKKQVKLLKVPANGQISIGKSWAGRQILVEELDDNEIRISAGVFMPDSQKMFHTKEAQQTLNEFNTWESKRTPKSTDTKKLFASLKKKK